jgi:Uma2 family endonuclease
LREYWIADWRDVTVQVYRRENTARCLVATLAAADTLTPPRLPGSSASVRSPLASGPGPEG